MMKNSLLKLAICSVALCTASLMASAQVREIKHDFSSFNALNVDNDFHVSIEKARRDYSISIRVDDVLKDYVQTYVKNHTLYITLDQKAIPSDVKKSFKSKNASAPVLDAVVYVPEDLSNITLAGKAVLDVKEEIECRDFTLTLKEESDVKNLVVDATNITVSSENKAIADLELYAENITLTSTGSSTLNVEQNSELLTLNTSGNSSMSIDGETLTIDITASGSSKPTINGKTQTINITGSGTSNVDAINLRAAEAKAKLSGNCKVFEAANEKLSLELSGNSTLVFDGEPAIEIVNIKSSTVTKYDNYKK